MKLIKPSFEIYEQAPGLEGIYEAIERAGRTCYKSKRPEGQTAKDFVDRMIASQHYAMLEHGTVYLKIPTRYIDISEKLDIPIISDVVLKYQNNPYSKVNLANSDEDVFFSYITTNYRVLVENGWLDDLKYLCEPTEHHEKRVTVRVTTDRGVSHEFVRHRVFSFAQESTRYCNYSKDKFGGEITFIIPSWLNIEEGSYGIGHSFGKGYFYECGENRVYCTSENKEEFFKTLNFLKTLSLSSQVYMSMLNAFELTPQQARQVLPNALKTELVMTGFTSDWRHFFDLRALGTTGAPHPDAKALALPLMEEFETKHLL